MRRFPKEQFLILKGLADITEAIEIPALAAKLAADQALVAAGAQLLGDEGLVEITEIPRQEFVLKEGGQSAAREKLPERRVLEALAAAGKPLTMQDLPEHTGLETKQVGASLRFLTAKGWAV